MTSKGEYRGIYTALVDDPDFQSLSPHAKLVFLFLKLQLGPSGIGTVYAAAISEQTGIPCKGVADAMRELSEGDPDGWIMQERNVVWIRNGLRYDPNISLQNDNHRKSVETHLRSLPKLQIVNEFASYYRLPMPYPSVSHADPYADQGKGEGIKETDRERETTIANPDGLAPGATPPHLSLVPAENCNGKTQPLPARRDRTSAAIRDQLAQVHAELAEGSRARLKATQARSIAAGMVFAYWAAVTNSERSLLDDKREKLIVARLVENAGNVGELLYAIDGALRDPWHNGEKDQTRRMGIEQILRNRGKVEELAGKVPGYRKGEAHRMAEKYASIFNTEHAA